MQRILSKIKYFEVVLSKSLKKKLILFFVLNPALFNIQDYEKQKWHGISDQSLFRLQNKFRKLPLLLMFYLTKFNNVISSSF